MGYYLELTIRLLAACLLGGIVGFERQSTRRPAGFRTHILVCVGSALVMITSEFIFDKYGRAANIDPARLGAQVISGIGFLGAGTIIREGVNVKGLTTAASLWAVSCVGIAVGIGFYQGALVATILIYITLILLKKIEQRYISHDKYCEFTILACSGKNLITDITGIFEKRETPVRSLDFTNEEGGMTAVRIIALILDNGIKTSIVNQLYELGTIRSVSEK